MIRRVHIKGYKSLRDVEVRLEPLTVLFGPNSAGKSNFLDALQLLSGIVRTRTLREAFAPPYRGKAVESFSFPPGGVEELLKQESARLSIEVDVELSDAVVETVNRQIRLLKEPGERGDGQLSDREAEPEENAVRERYLRYRIEIEVIPKFGFLRVADENVSALGQDGCQKKSRKPFLSKEGNRLHLRLEGQSHPKYHELHLDYCILSTPLYAPHYPHMVALREELANWFFFYLEPRERMRAPTPIKEVRHIGMMGEELAAFLNTLQGTNEKQFRLVERALKDVIPSIDKIDVSINQLGEVELRIFEGRTPIPARLMSEGTLRILGLLALPGTESPPSVIAFEEPENGIHPRRLEQVIDILHNMVVSGDSQVIVTTHSARLVDLMPRNSLFVTRRNRYGTEIRPFGDWGPLALGAGPEKADAIDGALNDTDVGETVSDRLLRGDFDA
ncbi:AAA family ATPase [Azospirillum halopraeferens]|uniref:AAA family ATPase n=1 Tax=Azospirillum halopraeferens TaxID=34010 RepID=UPI00042A2211|nr:AAA family ATPase [Azospirillum halopraeferens]